MAEAKASDDKARRSHKVRTGVVTSDKMDKTVIVSIGRHAVDRTFHKLIRLQKTVKAHDEKNVCRIGDRVQIIETRPLSKHKRWRVEKVLEQSTEEALST